MLGYIFILFIILIDKTCSLLNEAPYFQGSYLLRKTNDNSIRHTYSYLILNDNNNIKFKTIIQKGIFATKISRTGTIHFNKNYKSIFNPLYFITINKKLNNIIFDNDVNITIQFNNVNKYSYSLFGIQFPEIRYKQISDYNLIKNIRVQQKEYTLFITDPSNNNYYIFDLNSNSEKLPFTEIPINTLLFTQVFGFILNFLLVKFLDII